MLGPGIIYCDFKGKADIHEAVQECGRANTEDMLKDIAVFVLDRLWNKEEI